MPKLVTNIRQLRKMEANQPNELVATNELIAPLTGSDERADPLDVVLARLQVAYPALKQLIETLDLEPVDVTLPPGHTRLWELAGQSLEGNRTYSKAEAIERIRLRTSVTQERATKGFELMLESKAIEVTIDAITGIPNPNLFYLGGSTPY